MCSHTKHLHRYLLFLSNSYYNKSVWGILFPLSWKSNKERGVQKGGRNIERKKKSDVTFHRKKTRGEKYIIYHCIIGISRQPNQGALSDYFLPYHPKWWKRRRNYQPAADCWAGILMVIIGFLMVYLLCLSFPLSGLISTVIGAN